MSLETEQIAHGGNRSGQAQQNTQSQLHNSYCKRLQAPGRGERVKTSEVCPDACSTTLVTATQSCPLTRLSTSRTSERIPGTDKHMKLNHSKGSDCHRFVLSIKKKKKKGSKTSPEHSVPCLNRPRGRVPLHRCSVSVPAARTPDLTAPAQPPGTEARRYFTGSAKPAFAPLPQGKSEKSLCESGKASAAAGRELEEWRAANSGHCVWVVCTPTQKSETAGPPLPFRARL